MLARIISNISTKTFETAGSFTRNSESNHLPAAAFCSRQGRRALSSCCGRNEWTDGGKREVADCETASVQSTVSFCLVAGRNSPGPSKMLCRSMAPLLILMAAIIHGIAGFEMLPATLSWKSTVQRPNRGRSAARPGRSLHSLRAEVNFREMTTRKLKVKHLPLILF